MGTLHSLIAYPLFRLTICLATGIFYSTRGGRKIFHGNMGLRYGCFLWEFAEEYSGFPVGGGDGFSVEWPEGLFLVGRNIGTSSKGNGAI